MKKDIEWAKREIKELMTEESQNYPHDKMIEKEIVLGILNQLDEPETLSKEWLDENKSSWTKLKVDGYYIPVEKLQALLVPTRSETESVADVLTTFWKSYERLTEVLNMEVEEL